MAMARMGDPKQHRSQQHFAYLVAAMQALEIGSEGGHA
jgi:hypothetical protein